MGFLMAAVDVWVSGFVTMTTRQLTTNEKQIIDNVGLPCDLDNSKGFNGKHVKLSVNIHDRYRTNHVDFGNHKRFDVAPPPGKSSHLRTKFGKFLP